MGAAIQLLQRPPSLTRTLERFIRSLDNEIPPPRCVLFLEPFSYKKCWRNETITVVFSSSLKTSEGPEDSGRPF